MGWQCVQRFGEGGQRSQEDVVSALQFSRDGDYLAAADNGGRVVLFEQLKKDFADAEDLDQMSLTSQEAQMRPTSSGRGSGNESRNTANGSPDASARGEALDCSQGREQVYYKHMVEFQSHEREFDYLKSMEIDERVNQIKWFQSSSDSAD